MDVGTALRDAREQRGLSLDRLSRATKISVTSLAAIETNQRDKLPQRVFLRGFVRAYAREVGLNPEDTVARYFGQFESVTAIIAPAPATVDTGSAHAGTTPNDADRAGSRTIHLTWLGVFVVTSVVLASYAIARWPMRALLPRPPGDLATIARSASPAAAPTAPATRDEAATSGSDRPTATDATAAVLHLELRARGPCWLSATIDGTRVVYRLMQPGEQSAIDVHQNAVIRVGDPEAFAFSIDGREGRVLGLAGTAVTVQITPQNYREFLRRPE
jgi:cytoskeleton protein RodZ